MNKTTARRALRAAILPLALLAATGAHAAEPKPAPLQALPELKVPPYMGRWYQVALYPNVFQRQCASDTTAEYRLLPGGEVEVTNRCRTADGKLDQVVGVARPIGRLDGDRLIPAQLEVSFLPAWLRWLPVGWGSYWVVQLADDGRYAIVSEASREYLWVLSRQPRLAAADESAIRSKLTELGFDLQKLQPHTQSAAGR
jgi:apolipoprotein D and lipocalin family protein